MKHMKHVVAVFDGLGAVAEAIAALDREDVPLSRVSLFAPSPPDGLPLGMPSPHCREIEVRAIGRVIVCGPLAAAMHANESPDLVTALTATGIAPHHAIRYEWALRKGKTLLATTIGAAKAERIARALSRCHPLERVTAA